MYILSIYLSICTFNHREYEINRNLWKWKKKKKGIVYYKWNYYDI